MSTITGGKGGSEKTTTTLGLASVLDGLVLVVDADRNMPDLHTTTGAGQPVDAASDAPVWEPSVRLHPTDSTASVLSAPAGTDDDAFGRQLRTAAGDERHMVVGCPAGADPDAVVPPRAADGAVVMSPLCAPTLHDMAKTAAMARALGTPVVGCVISQSRVTPEAVSDLVGVPVPGVVPEESSLVPIRSTVWAAYRRIADRIPGRK